MYEINDTKVSGRERTVFDDLGRSYTVGPLITTENERVIALTALGQMVGIDFEFINLDQRPKYDDDGNLIT